MSLVNRSGRAATDFIHHEPRLTTKFRLFALALAALGALVTPLELVFIAHYGSLGQLGPFVLCALALVAIVAVLVRPSATVLRAFQVVMLLLFAGSLIGVMIHLHANLEVIQETRAHLSGLGLVWGVLTGAAPALAPGILAQVGLLGLIFTYRHPLLEPADGFGVLRLAFARIKGSS